MNVKLHLQVTEGGTRAIASDWMYTTKELEQLKALETVVEHRVKLMTQQVLAAAKRQPLNYEPAGRVVNYVLGSDLVLIQLNLFVDPKVVAKFVQLITEHGWQNGLARAKLQNIQTHHEGKKDGKETRD